MTAFHLAMTVFIGIPFTMFVIGWVVFLYDCLEQKDLYK